MTFRTCRKRRGRQKRPALELESWKLEFLCTLSGQDSVTTEKLGPASGRTSYSAFSVISLFLWKLLRRLLIAVFKNVTNIYCCYNIAKKTEQRALRSVLDFLVWAFPFSTFSLMFFLLIPTDWFQLVPFRLVLFKSDLIHLREERLRKHLN